MPIYIVQHTVVHVHRTYIEAPTIGAARIYSYSRDFDPEAVQPHSSASTNVSEMSAGVARALPDLIPRVVVNDIGEEIDDPDDN